MVIYGNITIAGEATLKFGEALIQSIKMIFTGNIGVNDLTGPIGISELVSQTTGIKEYFYMISMVSVSLGITNLLPIPALDGGKILILIIEIIRRKQMKIETEAKIQMIGFSILLALSLIVTYNDIIRIL